MEFREHVFRHLSDDWGDIIARASSFWSPRRRESANDERRFSECITGAVAAASMDMPPLPKDDKEWVDDTENGVIVDREEIAELW
jgi:hypothetical protein